MQPPTFGGDYQFTDEDLAWIADSVSAVSDDWVKRLEERGLPAAETLATYKRLLAETE